MTLTAAGTDAILELTGITSEDRAPAQALLEAEPTLGALAVQDFLASRLGSADETVPDLGVSEEDWISGYLRFTPEVLRWHRGNGIPEDTSRETLADLGRNMAINRRVHGRFGMDTFRWLTHHYAGRIYQLGRLQYLLHQPTEAVPGVVPGGWVVDMHIPESGGLGADAVAHSLALAAPFFARHFPARPVAVATCFSWLLDPYLAQHLAPESNIARFAALFSPYGQPSDSPTDAVYFTFRTRSMEHLAELPRATALQRLVLDRIAAGGTWQMGAGYLSLPG